MMGLLGGEESNLSGTPSMLHAPTCDPDDTNDSHHLDIQTKSTASGCNLHTDSKTMRDIYYSKRQEYRMKSNNQGNHKRSRNLKENVRNEECSNAFCDKSVYLEKYEMLKAVDRKHNVKCESHDAERCYDKYQCRHKNKYTNRESDQYRDGKRKTSDVESETRCHEGREARMDGDVYVREKQEVRREHRESTSGKSQKREESESDCKYEYHSSRESSKGSKHSKKRRKHSKYHSENGGSCGTD